MNKVRVFSTKTCPYCYMLKDYLKDNKIAFDDIMVDSDQDAAMEMVRISGQRGVPVAEINGSIVVGFDQVKINNLLGIA